MKIRIIPCDKGAFQPIEVSHAESVHIIGSHIVYELKTTNSERQSINLIISHPFAVDVTEDTQPDETKRETMAANSKKKPDLKRYRIIAYGPNEWFVVDLHHNNVLARCAFHQDAQEIVWHLENAPREEAGS